MSSLARTFYELLAPRPARAWVSKARDRRRIQRVAEKLSRGGGRQVLDGPFRGMEYVREAVGSAYLPKIAGCYEEELNGALERVVESAPGLVVDVGCAEGYYAVGLSRRLPEAEVLAFDIEPRARRLCALMAEANGVAERVRIEGACSPERLEELLAGAGEAGAFVLCDCEGFELELLDPARAPSLAKADILVEMHDFVNASISKAIRERFAPTHEEEIIAALDDAKRGIQSRKAFGGAGLDAEEARLAVSEKRPPGMEWAFLRPRGGKPGPVSP